LDFNLHGLESRLCPEPPNRRTPGRIFQIKSESPLDGIITGLIAEHGGNVSDQGIVTISGSSDSESLGYAARNAADLTNTSNYFHSKNEANQWLCYDFRNRKV
jgi:hypothetical protein